MSAWAADQKLSMPVRLLCRQPSRNSANSVKPASAIITPSSEILLCGRGRPLTRTLGSQLTRLYVLPVSPVVLIAWPTPVFLSSVPPRVARGNRKRSGHVQARGGPGHSAGVVGPALPRLGGVAGQTGEIERGQQGPDVVGVTVVAGERDRVQRHLHAEQRAGAQDRRAGADPVPERVRAERVAPDPQQRVEM